MRQSSGALLERLRCGRPLTLREQLALTVRLSLPAILAQLSSVVMQYIDAAMVGQLGAAGSASIGLVASSTWLFGGVCTAACTGFTVQAAQAIGAGDERAARGIVCQGLVLSLAGSLLLAALGAAISGSLPRLLGGGADIAGGASQYFCIYALALPALQAGALAGGLLQASGNMRVPGLLNVLTCVLDVVFNSLLIFPTGPRSLAGLHFSLPGAGLGVAGAALGTALAELVSGLAMLAFLLLASPALHLRRGERPVFRREVFHRALRIAVPVCAEQAALSSAQVMAMRIVSPLGTLSIAANSFAVTAESLCYMPGYGIAAAAAALIGQCVGAGRARLGRRLAWLCAALGMSIMACTGALLYACAPAMMALLTPDEGIRALGVSVLRIEAFAEPLFGAAIVVTGALRGAGDTLVPSLLNFLSMWAVRLPLAACLAPRLGLRGVWIAMCFELCVRGTMFLLRLRFGRRLGGAGGA